MPDMTLQIALAYLLTGAVLGPIFGSALKGGGFGVFGNICMGILGACVGGWVATAGNIVTGNDLLNNLLAAAAGVMIFSMLMGIIKRS